VKFKADGVDTEATVKDLIDAGKEVQQLSLAARNSMQKAGELKQSSARVIGMLSSDPIGTTLQVLQARAREEGADPRAVEGKYWEYLKRVVHKRLQWEQQIEAMPTAEREYHARLEVVRAKEAELAKAQQTIQAERATTAQRAAAIQADAAIDSALRDTGLPDDPEVIEQILWMLRRHWDAGEDLTELEAARKVKAQIEKRQAKPALSPEEIAKNPAMLEAIRQAELKLRAAAPVRTARTNGGATQPAPGRRSGGAKKRIPASEYFDR